MAVCNGTRFYGGEDFHLRRIWARDRQLAGFIYRKSLKKWDALSKQEQFGFTV